MAKAKRTFLGTVGGFFKDSEGNVNWGMIEEMFGWIIEDDGVDREKEDEPDVEQAKEFESGFSGENLHKAFEAYQKHTGAQALPTMVVGIAHQSAGNVGGAISALAEGKDPEANVGMLVGTVVGAGLGFALGTFIIPGIGNAVLSGALAGMGGWLGAAIVGGFVGGYAGKLIGEGVKRGRKSAKKLIFGDTEHLQKKYGLKNSDLERMSKYLNMRHSMVEAPYRQEVLENLHELTFNSKKGNIGINKLGLYFAAELVQLDLDPTMDDKSREIYEKELMHYLDVLQNSKAISDTVKDDIRIVKSQHRKLKEGGQTPEAYEEFFQAFGSDYKNMIQAMKNNPNFQAKVGRPRAQSTPRPMTTSAPTVTPERAQHEAAARAEAVSPQPRGDESDVETGQEGPTQLRQAQQGAALSAEQFAAYERKVAANAEKTPEKDDMGQRAITYSHDIEGKKLQVRYQEDYAQGRGHTNFSVDTSKLNAEDKEYYAVLLVQHALAHREQTGKSDVEIFAAGDKDFAIRLYKHAKHKGLSPKVAQGEFSPEDAKDIAAKGTEQAFHIATSPQGPRRQQ